MPSLNDTQKRKTIQVAEGYLDLANGMDSLLELKFSLKSVMCRRVIETLETLDAGQSLPAHRRAHVLFLKAHAQRIQQRLVEAVANFENAYQLDSTNPHIYLGLAWCYKRLGRLDLAIKSIEKAIELDPENPMAHFNLACYCALSGDENLAIVHLSFAIDLDPTYRRKMQSENDFDSLRDNPLFISVAKQLV